jgi:hypothetical protein
MIPKPLPIVSINSLPPLTWSEIAYAYSEQFIGWRTAVELAIKSIEQGRTDTDMLDLASVDKSETWKVGELLQRLVSKELPQSASSVREKWLFIFLQWLYDNRDRFPDPLQEIEEVYADFGYPEAINGFVRFLPPNDGYQPELHTKEENQQRLYQRWKEYLDRGVGQFCA